MNLNRRQFVAGALGAVAAAAAGNAAGAESPAELPIIDAHIHFWDLKELNPPWMPKAKPVLQQQYLAEQYRAATAGLNVARAVYVEIHEAPHRWRAEARYVTDVIASGTSPLAAAVLGGDPAGEPYAQYVRDFAKAPGVRGARFPYPAGAEADPKFLAGVRLLGELGLSFDLVTTSDRLASAVTIVAACPGTSFILDHCGCGNPDWYDPRDAANAEFPAQRKAWEDGVARLAERPNVACKISGVAEQSRREITAERLAPVVEHCLDRFGEDRVLFGSDWPVCLRVTTLAEWLHAAREITRRQAEGFQRKLFHSNSIKYYRLDGR